MANPTSRRRLIGVFLIPTMLVALGMVCEFTSRHMARGQELDEDHDAGFVGLENGTSLVIRPPVGGSVVIDNLTALLQLESNQATLGQRLSLQETASSSLLSALLSASSSSLSIFEDANQNLNSTIASIASRLSSTEATLSMTQQTLKNVTSSLPRDYQLDISSLNRIVSELQANASMSASTLSVEMTRLTVLEKSLSSQSLLLSTTASQLSVSQNSLVDTQATLASLSSLFQTSFSSAVPASCTIYSFGGSTDSNGPHFTNVDSFQPSSQSWNSLSPLLTPRGLTPAAGYLRAYGLLIVAGGVSSSTNVYSSPSAEVYNIAKNLWTATASMLLPRYWTAGISLPDGKRFLVVGGRSPTVIEKSCEIYDPESDTWTAVNDLAKVRYSHAMVLYNNVPVILGGRSSSGSFSLNCEQYSEADGLWSSFPTINLGRSNLAAASVLSKIYLMGGYLLDGSTPVDMEVFDGTSWSLVTTPLLSNRQGVVGISLFSHLVVLGGGVTGVSVYNPLIGTLSSIAPLSFPRYFPAAVAVCH